MQLRLRNALLAHSPVRGATKLVATPPPDTRRRIRRYAVAVAAGAAVALIVLLSGVPKEEVSASVVLAQSLAVLSEQQGAELTEYELLLEGAARGLSAELADGTSLVEELVDHDEPGRYHVSCFGPDGALLAEFAQDPLNGQRSARLQVDDKGYYFRFTMAEPPRVGFPELTRSVIQTGIAFMQASGDPKLTTFDVVEGTRYRIELPQVASEPSDVPWELTAAKVIVDASDFRVHEFEASGAFLGQEGRLRYRLIHHETRTPEEMASTPFQVEPRPGDRELDGVATGVPGRDVMRVLLQELDAS